MNDEMIAKEPARDPQVRSWIAELHSAVEEANKVAAELDSRLAPILRSEPPRNPETSKEDCELVTVADEIRSAVRGVSVLIERQRSMLDRAEI